MTTKAHQRTPHHVSTQPGMHPDDQPETTGDYTFRRRSRSQDADAIQQVTPHADDEQEDTSIDQGYDAYDGRPAPSTRRFSSSQVPTVATPRNVIRVTHHAVPPRAHAGMHQQRAATPPPQRHPSPHPTPMPAQTIARKHPHYLGFAGMALVIMVIGWLVLSLLATWWQGTLDEWRYGRPRTYQTDAVVGGDSAQTPTHFIATNMAGHVSVIEMHASDPNKMVVLIAPMQAGPLDPVTLVIKDVNHDGKPDLLVKVQSAVHVFLNDGHGNFGPLKPGEKIDVG